LRESFRKNDPALLDLWTDMASVAPLHERFPVNSPCLRFLIIALVSSLTIGPLLAQEAVETPASAASESPTKAAKDKNPDQSKPGRSLEENMRPEEFKAAGLDKLSEDELQHLDAYLQGYRQSTQKKAAEQAQARANEEIKKAEAKADEAQKATEEAKRDAASARTRLDSLVSRVDGSIEGIKGNTVIRLEDGSVWKQANHDEHFRAQVMDHPAAVVLRTSFGYKMRIEGMPEFYVDPIARP
jgi:predicted ribosome quality control (RQC) complex YloA/Tae2 family protein